MSNVNIKKSIPADISLFMQMEREPANKEFVGQSDESEHLMMIKSPVIEHLSIFNPDNKLVGFAILKGLDNPRQSIELKRIVINLKGKGYGQSSMENIKAYAFDGLQAKEVWLDVFDYNSRAIHVYQKTGFIIDKERSETIIHQGIEKTKVILTFSKEAFTKNF